MNFYVPPYMKENYDKFLQTSACHTLYVCKDVSKEEPEWIEFRGEISPINYKSKQYSSDNVHYSQGSGHKL